MKKFLLTCLMLFVALSLFAGGSGEKKGNAVEEVVIAVPALPSWSELLIRAEMEAADATNSPVIFLSFNHPDAKEFHELIGRLAEKASL